MTIRYTFDIHSQEPMYAVCDAVTGECYHQTSSIFDAIKMIQGVQV
jgi:hypothetical protein